MALTKVDFKGGKIIETSAAGVASTANGLDAILATLVDAKEIENGVINLDPSDTDVAVASNINNAEVCILITDGLINVKLNGSATEIPVETLLIIFGTGVTEVTVTNPSAIEARSVRKYLATTTN